jgi:hypothetical protein
MGLLRPSSVPFVGLVIEAHARGRSVRDAAIPAARSAQIPCRRGVLLVKLLWRQFSSADRSVWRTTDHEHVFAHVQCVFTAFVR